MFFIALKRLWTRPLLTLLSIVGVILAVGLVTSIPIFSQAVSFVMLLGILTPFVIIGPAYTPDYLSEEEIAAPDDDFTPARSIARHSGRHVKIADLTQVVGA